MSDEIISFPTGVIPRSGVQVRMTEYAGLQNPGVPPVVSINDHRPPVWYDVAVCHHYDGTVQTWVRAVDIERQENRDKIADALQQAADGLRRPFDREPEPDRGVDLPDVPA
jgi:hypothetical protein